ncbi:MAG: phosphoribosyl-AMP cyclohydrolase [Deltaproteobacteria bacterium]|nr:phosphoribosyl-AMP cyclohydrolase [Deltaproteobacteria bacterium]
MVELDFEKGEGLIPVVAQDYETGDVLMLAYMNREAWEKTVETGKATYWSRSRKALWVKGETSGNVQIVKEIFVDCDLDTLVLKVDQQGGAACHMGYRSCFYRKVLGGEMEIIGERVFDPEDVYKK